MKSNTKRSAFAILAIVLLVTAIFGAVPTQKAFAGSKGQHVKVTTGKMFSWVELTGYNQNGKWVTEDLNTKFGTSVQDTWWWVGTVNVTDEFPWIVRCHVYVPPTLANSDVVSMSCKL
jgi:hypothetical protein